MVKVLFLLLQLKVFQVWVMEEISKLITNLSMTEVMLYWSIDEKNIWATAGFF